jgi:hypothetical protein
MKLKQKFFDIYTSYYKKSNELDKMVELADDYAIDFAEWRLTTFIKNADQYTMKELLEIFKKEKGL